MAKSIMGIDIGAGLLKLAVCDASGVTQIAMQEMPDNLVKDGRITSFEAMSDVVRNTVRDNKITTKDCALALHTHDVYTRRITMPAMTADELQLNLPFEFRDYIADGREKYRFDYAVLETKVDSQGQPQEMDILAAAAPIETIDTYANMLRRAGLKLKIAAPAIMAYGNIVAAYQKRNQTSDPASASFVAQDFCFIDVGSHNTKAYLFPKGKYEVVRMVEFGTASLVQAVAEHFSVDPAIAKTYLESNYEDAQTIQPCLDLYERLGVEVARIISFYNFNYPDSQLGVVHYCGSGTSIEPLLAALGEHVSIDLQDIGTIMPASQAYADYVRICPTAVGIALQ